MKVNEAGTTPAPEPGSTFLRVVALCQAALERNEPADNSRTDDTKALEPTNETN